MESKLLLIEALLLIDGAKDEESKKKTISDLRHIVRSRVEMGKQGDVSASQVCQDELDAYNVHNSAWMDAQGVADLLAIARDEALQDYQECLAGGPPEP